MKNDRAIRIRMVQSYIKTLNPLDAILKPMNIQIQVGRFNDQEQQQPQIQNGEQ